MTLPRTVAEVVAEHVVFEVECIDRMYCNVYVPQLQYAAGIVGYLHHQLGLPVASTAPLGKITDAFSAAMRWPSSSNKPAAEPSPAVPKWIGSRVRCKNHAGIAVAPMSTPVYVASRVPKIAAPKMKIPAAKPRS